MKIIYPAVFYPFFGWQWRLYCRVFRILPGCITEGRNLEEAFEMATDAASGWVLEELEEGNPVPKASDYSEVKARENGQVNIVLLDIDKYAEQYGEKAVRKNVTIPAWLNTFAEKRRINFSQVLQEAILAKAQKTQ